MHDIPNTGNDDRDQPEGPLPFIDGLDAAAGIRRMEGDVELYIDLLRDFLNVEGDAADVIAAALANGDVVTATRCAHTVKGLAGTLGAVRLQPAAFELEMALREAQPGDRVDALLKRFASALAELAAELSAKLPAQVEPALPDGPADPLELAAACRALRPLLAASDMRAGKVMELNAEVFRAGFRDDWRPIEQAIRRFDFEIADNLLLAACARHGLPTRNA